jgi:hypothetical protein
MRGEVRNDLRSRMIMRGIKIKLLCDILKLRYDRTIREINGYVDGNDNLKAIEHYLDETEPPKKNQAVFEPSSMKGSLGGFSGM